MSKQTPTIKLARVYGLPKSSAGYRVLLYAAKDEEHNNAVVLKAFLEQARKKGNNGASR